MIVETTNSEARAATTGLKEQAERGAAKLMEPMTVVEKLLMAMMALTQERVWESSPIL
jgi:hypothetical protein